MLKEHQDAYGREMLAYLNGEHCIEVNERDDGWISASPPVGVYFADFKSWHPVERRAMRYACGRVLDIGCGAGRVALHLQKKGFDVVGIDVSPLAIKACKRRGLKRAHVMSITQLSSKLGTFDTILMMGNNFGLFGNVTRARWLLKRFRRMSSDTARIIAESTDPYQTKVPAHLAYHKWNKKRGRMPGQLRLRLRYQGYATPWFDYLLVSQDEMSKTVAGTGWSVKRFIEPGSPVYVGIIEKE